MASVASRTDVGSVVAGRRPRAVERGHVERRRAASPQALPEASSGVSPSQNEQL
jgi:hypothetical protein